MLYIYVSQTVPLVVKRLSDDLCFDYLRNRYQPYEEEWPPNQPTSYLNLSLVHYKGTESQWELFKISKHCQKTASNVDKLTSSHSNITEDIEAIFMAEGDNRSPKHILIEGAPGIGKTVLAKEIAYQWANGKILQEYKLVFLLYLRDPKLHSVKSLNEFLELFTSENSSDLIKYVKHYANSVAFVFDGFNEYPISLQYTSYITDIIKGVNDANVFLNSMVVVTSRPTTTVFLHAMSDKIIEILGFCKEERNKYLSISFDSSLDKKHEFDKYLKKFPIIDNLCYIPLYLTILVYLFQQDSLPETITEMNEYFIIHTIYHCLEKHKLAPHGIAKKLKDLPQNILDYVYQLSQLAFEGLRNDQLVFTCEEIKLCSKGNDIPEVTNGFGLLQAVQHNSKAGADKITAVNFCHFTMQEYFAAFHVSALPSEKRLALINTTFWRFHFNYMWIMYAGIAGVKSITYAPFIVSDAYTDKIKCLHLFQSYMEANSNVDMPKAFSSIFTGGEIILSNITLLPHHISSLVFFMSSCVQQWKILKLNNCNLGDVGMNSLLEYVNKKDESISTLEYVDLSENKSSPWGVYCTIIKNCCVSSLALFGDEQIAEYVKEIANSLQKNTTLHSLTLCKIGKASLQSIEDILVELKEFNLYFGHDTERIKVLKTQLKPTLYGNNRIVNINILSGDIPECLSKTINLFKKSINDDMLYTIAFSFYTVLKLDLSHNNITDAGALVISDSLRQNNTLKELNLSHNQIGIVGMNKLSESVHSMPLEYADLSGNESSPWGMYCAIIRYCSVNNLTLFGDEDMKEYIKGIIDSLLTNNTLQSLSLCKIGKIGMLSIESILVTNTTLSELNLSWGSDANGTKMLTKSTSFSNNRVVLNVNILYDDYHESVYNTLDLFNKNIDNDAVYLITFCLRNNATAIRKLDLSYNSISGDAMEELSNCIAHCKLLEYADLSGNESSPWGVYCAVIRHCCVNNLSLFGEEGMKEYVKDIIDSLQANTSLKSLTLCKIGEIRLQLDINILIKNIAMKDLYLPQSSIINGTLLFSSTDDGEASINRAVDINILCNSDFRFSSKIINLSHVNITEDTVCLITFGLYDNKLVRKLNLSHNNITDIGATAIGVSLQENTTLKELNLSHNRISIKGMNKLSKYVQTMPLEYVNLSGNDSSPWGVYCTIIEHCCVKSLTICGTEGIKKCIKNVILSLQSNTRLNSLTLCTFKRMRWSCEYDMVKHLLYQFRQQNHVTDITIISIRLIFNSLHDNKDVTSSNNNRVVNINLIYDYDYKNFSSEGLKIIAEAIRVDETLQGLDISHNRISDSGVAVLSSCLKNNSTLKELDLSWNRITNKGAKEIAEAIKVNATLQKLDISHNSISNDGVIIISECMKSNNTLQELHLSWNRITGKGAKKIAEAIQVNTTLLKLDISHSSVSDDGVMIISDCLKSNNTLQEIDLSWNRITSKGAKKLAEAIQVNATLQKLVISHNSISDEGVLAINDSLKRNKTLKELDLSWNRITKKGAEKISKTVTSSMLLMRLNISHNSVDITSYDQLDV